MTAEQIARLDALEQKLDSLLARFERLDKLRDEEVQEMYALLPTLRNLAQQSSGSTQKIAAALTNLAWLGEPIPEPGE